MLTVGIPYITNKNNMTRINTRIDMGEKTEILWFETEECYGKYFDTERGDAFAVMLFYWAMKNGHDITFECVLSENLYYNLQYYMINALANADSEFKRIKLICRTSDKPIESERKTATGISCGIDSISTIRAHTDGRCPKNHELSYLTFFNAGAAYYGDGTPVKNENGIEVNKLRLENAKKFAEESGIPLIYVNSNISEILKLEFELTHTYRNCGIAMLLQKLISTYYYSSGGFETLHITVSPRVTAAHYDDFTLPLISNGTIAFYSAMNTYTRFEKTEYIADYPLAAKYLSVCFRDGENCGRCPKCIRTLITLDVTGALDNFAKVFDVEYYKKKRHKYISVMLARKKQLFYSEIYKQCGKRGIKLPVKAYLLVPAEKLKMFIEKINEFIHKRFTFEQIQKIKRFTRK